jgi:hypothetical protein
MKRKDHRCAVIAFLQFERWLGDDISIRLEDLYGEITYCRSGRDEFRNEKWSARHCPHETNMPYDDK